MDSRHTLHDPSSTASTGQSSHSYTAWRNAQQQQPRILQYNPGNQSGPGQSNPALQNPAASAGSSVGNSYGGNLDNKLLFPNTAAKYSPSNFDHYQQQLAANSSHAYTSQTQQENQGALSAALNDAQASQVENGTPDNKSSASLPPNSSSTGRTLATSKRAAQNRAAQRAFRQRKDRYIKSLEQKATEYDLSQSIIADLRKENIYLRDYVVRLQNEVDSLNSELGRAPMFGQAGGRSQQAQQSQAQQASIQANANANVNSIPQHFSLSIDPQTAAAVAAAAASSHQDTTHPGLTRLAPAESSTNSMNMPAGEDDSVVKADDGSAQSPSKKRGRKKKGDNQLENQ